MSWTELSGYIEAALGSVGYVNSIYRGDVYDRWNNTNVAYVSAVYENINTPPDGDSIEEFDVRLTVADRLVEGEYNDTFAQDFARNAILVAVAALRHSVLEVDVVQMTPFVQKFADNLAGYTCQLAIKVTTNIQIC